MKKTMILLLVLICSAFCFADLKKDAESLHLEGNGYMKRTKGMAAGLERDKLLQAAKEKFEKALDAYNAYIEKNPAEAARLDSRLTELNAQIFWCSKLTTMAYYNATKAEKKVLPEEKKTEPAPQPAAPEPAVSEPEVKEPEVSPEQPEPAETPKVQEPEPPVPVKENVAPGELSPQEKDFLARLSGLARKRRFVEIGRLCNKASTGSIPGVSRELALQIGKELELVNVFFFSVFDRLLEAKPGEIVHLRKEGTAVTRMTVKSVDQGLLIMDVKEPGIEMPVEMAMSVFGMDDGFLELNVKSRTKKVMIGMGSFYLLESEAGKARKLFAEAGGMEGDPSDVSGFISRADKLLVIQKKEEIARKDQKLRDDLAEYLKDAISYYERKNYDYALNNLKRILDKSKKDLDYLKPLSEQCSEAFGKPLPDFARTLLEECDKCNKTRIVTCIQCKGAGRVKTVLGKARWIRCATCRGKKKITCPWCKKRLNSSRNKKIVADLKKLLGGKGK